METGVDLIAAERARQQEQWSAEHDDRHREGELALAAVCYAAPIPILVERPSRILNGVAFVDPWPFPELRTSSRTENDGDRRKNGPLGRGNTVRPMPASGETRIDFLVKAGALIAAEIDRLHRVEGEGKMPFTRDTVRDYLDRQIAFWTTRRDYHAAEPGVRDTARVYLKAYETLRTLLFGEL